MAMGFEVYTPEYPRNTRGVPLASHRELLLRDLLHLGASRKQILSTRESAETQAVRLASLEALQSCLDQPHSDLAAASPTPRN